MPPTLEIATFNAASSIVALHHGASRIELCANQSLGGTTPSLETLTTLTTHIKNTITSNAATIPINVMIRPRGGNFIYTPAEITQMKNDISTFSVEGVDINGFVFGVLTPDGKIDEVVCKQLLDHIHSQTSHPTQSQRRKHTTFHRAFDLIPATEMASALETLISLGFTSVLTSGGAANAFEGRDVLARLVSQAAGRIEVIVGGGVRSGNLKVLVKETEALVYHSSAIVGQDGEGDVASGEEVERLSAILKS
ncbi:hypothetical protein ONS95_008807 [Cadophora gregata]|uniref:uncharacterized protein n=1 Tax=Cadophora gregata TaxID=51156 RepID=UPI0026DB1927|nr:uncharacterized protein ONS95_008807 [Cadophora gregata]KAK0123810.1 hypothetical protein ONS95_008807 [Cadophora gregata]KAK0130153.1 hypothetical protein ONS96_000677 [Cadophora gregata f. sp. sojae]